MSAAVVVFVLCAVACALAHVAILRSVVRKASEPAPASAEVPRSGFGAELAWAVLPMLALALVLTATWAQIRARTAPPDAARIMEVAR